jgi:pimeloyl-ACP methyl ester carboxylesterase
VKNVRFYGESPYKAAVVHGGPGAAGEMAPVARELATVQGILEPLQTKATLDGQVRELHDILEKNADLPVILIGHSWGAWLSFITAARYPSMARKLVLIGSGPFEQKYADGVTAERLNRLPEADRVEVFQLVDKIEESDAAEKDEAMARLGELFARADSYAPLPPSESERPGFDYEINRNVWGQAEAMRISGELLKTGEKIKCPVVAIHGDYDPHLAEGVKEPLSRVLKDFRFVLLEKCGHEPWLERFARDKFYKILKNELE